MYTYGCFTLLDGRNEHSIGKQLFSKLKKKSVKEMVTLVLAGWWGSCKKGN